MDQAISKALRLKSATLALLALIACSCQSADAPTAEPAAAASTPADSQPTSETKPVVAQETEPAASPSEEQAPAGAALTGSKILVKLDSGKSFTLQLDVKGAPKSSAGIEGLVKKGFYDGTRVHRVEPGFCVQWGDPLSKNGVDAPGVGTGGSGTQLPFEAGTLPFRKGVLGVASKGAGTGGDGQIFVMTGDAPSLDGSYAAIGKVINGMDVVMKIERGVKIVSMKVVK